MTNPYRPYPDKMRENMKDDVGGLEIWVGEGRGGRHGLFFCPKNLSVFFLMIMTSSKI